MPIVNYVKEHIRFMEFATDHHLSSGERLLWYALMHILNQRAEGNRWPDGMVEIANERLLAYCPMKFDTLATARNNLKQRGLIDYTPGDKRKKAPAYRVNYFDAQAAPGERYPEETGRIPGDLYRDADYQQDDYQQAYASIFYPRDYPEKSDNVGDNNGGNMGDNPGDNPGDKVPNIYINYTKQGYIPKKPLEEDDDEQRTAIRTRKPARVREAAESWKIHVGREMSSALAKRIGNYATLAGFGPGVIDRAVEIAAGRAEKPAQYIMAVLQDWATCGVRSSLEAEKLFTLGELAKREGPESEEWDELNAFREELQERAIRDAEGRNNTEQTKEALV